MSFCCSAVATTDILLSTYYVPASRSQQNFVRAVDILADLQQRAKGSDRPNMSRLVRPTAMRNREVVICDTPSYVAADMSQIAVAVATN